MSVRWKWDEQNPSYGNFGNANQWTVNAGLHSLARESAQNTNDARLPDESAELVYTFIRLAGAERDRFQAALRWEEELRPHLESMGAAAGGAVSAGQLRAGLEALSAADSLVLLKISDYGCAGLTGAEFYADLDTKDYGNFIKLCRLDLFSGKDEASGGSFGLGKAVYWRFSRLQTVLFNSTLSPQDAVDGRSSNRVFGVNQGVMHRLDGRGYQGRGHFGVLDGDHVVSVWDNDDLVDRLHLRRSDTRPGTTALLVGFYDPDEPERGLGKSSDLHDFAGGLRQGIEENFWPLLTRARLKVSVEVVDRGKITDEVVDPDESFIELTRALRRFDAGDVDETLTEAGSVVVRDIPIDIPRRQSGDAHPAFQHKAKLVVTLSDDQRDVLENHVCLFRKPEMVVQTIKSTFEGGGYHAFLVAGAAIRPDDPTDEDLWADDFLRFAEPPPHDRWIPGSGRNQTSHANLTAHYVAPWLPNLRKIEDRVRDALVDLFGPPPPAPGKPPEAVFKHLRFLSGESGEGGVGGTRSRKPSVELVEWSVRDGRWHVRFIVEAPNRTEGWLIEPCLALVGLDGRPEIVHWSELRIEDGGTLDDGAVLLRPAERRRKVKSVLAGVSAADLPIPAEESAVDVVLRRVAPYPTSPAGAER